MTDEEPSLLTANVELGPLKFVPHDGGFFSNFNFLVGEMVLGRLVYPIYSVEEISGTQGPAKHFAYAEGGCANSWFRYFKPIQYYEGDNLHERTDAVRSLNSTWGGLASEEFRFPAKTLRLYTEDYFPDWRAAVHRVVSKRIRLNEEIESKVDAMLAEMPKRRIGVHIRHPAHFVEQGLVLYGDYFALIDRVLEKTPTAQIFLATDNDFAIAVLKDRYGDKVHYFKNFVRESIDDILMWAYSLIKGKSDDMGFVSGVGFQTHYKLAAVGGGAKGIESGKEAVMDVYTLAACDDFVCTASNFTLTCSFLNPRQNLHLVSKGAKHF